jgi:hypothetical protein
MNTDKCETLNAPVANRLIVAVWRRMVVVRIAESIGVACVIASALGMALMPVFWMREQSGMPLAGAMLGLGIVCGAIWGFNLRPTRLDAAGEADRQLKLDDLLGTVLLMQRGRNDLTTPQWRQALGAMADNRCRGLRASSVIAGKFGLRAWGGIGVSAGLLLTIGMLTSGSASLQAATDGGRNIAGGNAKRSVPSGQFASASDQTSGGRPAGENAIDENSDRSFVRSQPDSSQTSGRANANGEAGAAGASGTGGGSARTSADSGRATNLAQNAGHSNAQRGAEAAAGNGSADTNATASGSSNGNVMPGTNHPNAAAPWQSTQWPADKAAADSAVRAGHVPDVEADLVRDYFQQDSQ